MKSRIFTRFVNLNKLFGAFSACLAAGAILTTSASVWAQSAYVQENTHSRTDEELAAMDEPEAPAPKKVPANKNGFQIALGSGYAFPIGSVDGSMDQSSFVAGQVPLILDLGVKTSESVYVGAYLGLGIGRPGDAIRSTCSASAVDCSLTTFRIGVNFQYHLKPREKINPYVGYGLGYESATLTAVGPGGSVDLSVSGFEIARLGLGFDYRANKTIGIGPYIDSGFGTYTTLSLDGQSATINSPSMHGWINLGVRAVLFP